MMRLAMCAAAAIFALVGCEKHSVTDAGDAVPPVATTETVAAPLPLPVEQEAAAPRVDSEPRPPRVDADTGPPRVDAPATTPTL
jgi:hypothetical protein